MNHYNLITILGPTASGKTRLAAKVAHKLGSAVISADSRQVYRNMTIGTGKDYNDYIINGFKVQSYLVDICDAGTKYNLFEYQRDFYKIFRELESNGKIPVLCGGSGLYIEAAVKGYQLLNVPLNPDLRKKLEQKSDNELKEILASLSHLHNKTDIDTRKRTIRAIEIASFQKENKMQNIAIPVIKSLFIGLAFDRKVQKQRITARLNERLKSGMIQEIEMLLNNGIDPDDLVYYGLEYKYITLYLNGSLSYEEMVQKLEIAIHQFSKRQMTWFRKMEREGIQIHWLNPEETDKLKVEKILHLLEAEN